MRNEKRLRKEAELVTVHTVLRSKEVIEALWRLTDGATMKYNDVFSACLLIVQELLRQWSKESMPFEHCDSSSLFKLEAEVLRGNIVLEEALDKGGKTVVNMNRSNSDSISIVLDLSDDTKKFLESLIEKEKSDTKKLVEKSLLARPAEQLTRQ